MDFYKKFLFSFFLISSLLYITFEFSFKNTHSLLAYGAEITDESSEDTFLRNKTSSLNNKMDSFVHSGNSIKVTIQDYKEIIIFSDHYKIADIIEENQELQKLISYKLCKPEGCYYYIPENSIETLLQFPYNIKFIKIREEYVKESEIIPFTTIKKADNSQPLGKKIDIQKGENGQKETSKKNIYHGENLISSEIITENIIKEKIDYIYSVGTKLENHGISGCNYWNSYVDTLTVTEDESSWLKRVMNCESHCNPNATNGVNNGLMQFASSTYKSNGGKNIWDGYEQIEIALKMYKQGRASAWGCK